VWDVLILAASPFVVASITATINSAFSIEIQKDARFYYTWTIPAACLGFVIPRLSIRTWFGLLGALGLVGLMGGFLIGNAGIIGMVGTSNGIVDLPLGHTGAGIATIVVGVLAAGVGYYLGPFSFLSDESAQRAGRIGPGRRPAPPDG
jgi:hypothetical protein